MLLLEIFAKTLAFAFGFNDSVALALLGWMPKCLEVWHSHACSAEREKEWKRVEVLWLRVGIGS